MHALKIALFAMLVVAAAAHANGRNEGKSHAQGIGRGGVWAHFQQLFSRFKSWIQHHDSHPGGGDSGGDVVAAPEPATMLMIGAMGGILAVRRRVALRA